MTIFKKLLVKEATVGSPAACVPLINTSHATLKSQLDGPPSQGSSRDLKSGPGQHSQRPLKSALALAYRSSNPSNQGQGSQNGQGRGLGRLSAGLVAGFPSDQALLAVKNSLRMTDVASPTSSSGAYKPALDSSYSGRHGILVDPSERRPGGRLSNASGVSPSVMFYGDKAGHPPSAAVGSENRDRRARNSLGHAQRDPTTGLFLAPDAAVLAGVPSRSASRFSNPAGTDLRRSIQMNEGTGNPNRRRSSKANKVLPLNGGPEMAASLGPTSTDGALCGLTLSLRSNGKERRASSYVSRNSLVSNATANASTLQSPTDGNGSGMTDSAYAVAFKDHGVKDLVRPRARSQIAKFFTCCLSH